MGLEPNPKRSQRSWAQFAKSHAKTLWGCDFFSVKSVTTKGVVNLYFLVFVHFDSRRALVSARCGLRQVQYRKIDWR